MDKEKFDELEVKPASEKIGVYHVVIYNFIDNTYFYAWLNYDGNTWDYKEHQGSCYVCFIFDYREN